MICAGIDAGSRTTKAVLMDTESLGILAMGLADQGIEQERIALNLFEKLLKESGNKKSDVKKIIATGYGRDIIGFADTTVTEITCQAVGVRHFLPKARTIIDIGGQDSKIVRLDDTGRVRDFAMNDRCAAGTGRFLEVVSERLNMNIQTLGDIASKSKMPAPISSMCVVFAETEIIGLLASRREKDEIVAGVQAAIAAKIATLVGRKTEQPVVFTGGVALVSGMAAALSKALGEVILVSPQPQMTGAIGAAIIASEQIKGSVRKENF
jgi:predicted CoA-substrate-specific enzyme activase